MGFGGGSGSSSIGTATDANVSNPVTNNILVYSVGKWTNTPLTGTAALPVGGGVETVSTNAATTGSITINIATANVFNMTLTGNTTFTFSGATAGKACAFSLYLSQDGTGSRTATWPTIKWAGGTTPTLTTAAGATDVMVFETLNGGSTWYGSLVGANFL